MSLGSLEQRMPYYRAFYGEGLTEDSVREITDDFNKMVKKFNSDLVERIPALEVDYELRKRCILTGLQAMHILGADHPNVYSKHPKFQNQAMLSASGVYNEAMVKEKTQDTVDEMQSITEQRLKELDGLETRDAKIYAHYEMWFQKLLKEDGLDKYETQVNAYRCLIDMPDWEQPYGKDYFTIGWKLPMELGIFEDQRVIDACNEHPTLRSMKRGKTRMRINNVPATAVLMNPNIT